MVSGSVGTVGGMDLAARGPSAAVRVALLVAAVFLVTGALACSNDDPPAGPTATLDTEPDTDRTTTTTVEDVEAEVKAAYLAAFDAYYDAVSNPAAPNDLGTTHAQESLDRAEDFVDGLKQKNQRAAFPQGRPSASDLSISVDGDMAEVSACERDSSVVVQLPGKEVVDDDSVSSVTQATLKRGDVGWRQVRIEIVRTWNDDLGCDRS